LAEREGYYILLSNYFCWGKNPPIFNKRGCIIKKFVLSRLVLFIANIGFCNACCRDLNFEILQIEIPEIVNEHFEKVGKPSMVELITAML
jgi:hypothetical protein